MAVSRERYKNLNHTLRKLRVQILDGVPWAKENTPAMSTPQECFDWLKARTIYKKDPKGIELFQSLPTLLSGSRTGTPGAGDCDCFTIGFLTLLVANGLYDDCGICLVGRNKLLPPVHIYSYTGHNGEREIVDLTNKKYNYERFYPYYQFIPLIIHPLEEKNMVLELADGTDLSSKKGKARRRAKRELKKDLKFQQNIENMRTQYDTSVPQISPEVDANYTYLPNSDNFVRNDMYDDMGTAEFQNTMLEEGVSPARIFELSGGRAARKMVKAKSKGERKTLKTRLKTRVSGEDKAKTRMKLFDKAGDLIGNFVGGKKVSGGGDDTPEPSGGGAPPAKSSGFKMPDIPTPVYVIGGLLIAGGIAYKMFGAKK